MAASAVPIARSFVSSPPVAAMGRSYNGDSLGQRT